jgi:L-threonylcarbamoyladenylate synthase
VTERLTTSPADLERAATLLRAGGLVAIPTETVYGLAVRADDDSAVMRLFAAKGRPSDNPLIVHVAAVEDVTQVARHITPLARQLLEHFAPGPLTVVLDARDDLPRAVTGGLDTVAVRVPDHPVALEVLRRCRTALAAPSANRSARPSPTCAEHVLADLDGRIDAVVDAGPTRFGLESTVVDARGPTWTLLREGAVTREDILAALGPDRTGPDAGPDAAATGRDLARSPGTRHHHYAPALPVHLADPGSGATLAASLVGAVGGSQVGLVVVGATPRGSAPDGVVTLAVMPDAAALAVDLFTLLRRAERAGLGALVFETVPEAGIGRAVMDRLRRAAEASGGSPGQR